MKWKTPFGVALNMLCYLFLWGIQKKILSGLLHVLNGQLNFLVTFVFLLLPDEFCLSFVNIDEVFLQFFVSFFKSLI